MTALALTVRTKRRATRIARERDDWTARAAKLLVRNAEVREMNGVLADTVARLCFELDAKERDPLGLGFHETPTWKRS